jgi:ABC-2 type transport system permease protein
VVYFIVFLALAACIAFCMNILTAIIAFYVGEAGNFENVINHVVSILSGSLVPISFFPDSIREIVIRSPFPSMIFVPAQSLKFTTFDASVSQSLFTALFWAVSLSITTAFLWNYSIKKYEAYGI